MITAIRVIKGMQGIVCVHTKLLTGDKERAARSKRQVASPLTDRPGADGCRRIIARSRNDLYFRRKSQFFRDLWSAPTT